MPFLPVSYKKPIYRLINTQAFSRRFLRAFLRLSLRTALRITLVLYKHRISVELLYTKRRKKVKDRN